MGIIASMEILITGGTGLIGSHLLASLLDRGDRPTVLTRRPERAALRWPAVNFIRTFDAVDSNHRFDAMVNLAGESIASRPWTSRRRRQIRESRILTTEHLVELIARMEHKPQVLVSASAIGYYGQHESQEFTEENAPIPGSFSHELCHNWEARAMRARDYGVRVCILRNGVVLARDGGLLQRMLPAFRLGLGARLGNGRQWMPWIHIADMVMLISRAIADDRFNGALNAVSSHPVTNAEFTRTLGAALHRPAPWVVPAFLLRLVLGQMAEELLLGGARVLPARLAQLDVRLRFDDLPAALEELLG